MKPRPKKPEQPKWVCYQLGDSSVTLTELQSHIAKLLKQFPQVKQEDLVVCGHDYEMTIDFKSGDMEQYNKDLEKYKAEYKAWKKWREDHAAEVDVATKERKRKAAQAKLEKTKTRLRKQIDEIQKKLENM